MEINVIPINSGILKHKNSCIDFFNKKFDLNYFFIYHILKFLKMIEDIGSDFINMMDFNLIREADNRYMFINEDGNPNKRARELGLYIYKIGGTKLMHLIMNYLLDKVTNKINNGEDWLIYDLRQLEVCWNGIGEWQA